MLVMHCLLPLALMACVAMAAVTVITCRYVSLLCLLARTHLWVCFLLFQCGSQLRWVQWRVCECLRKPRCTLWLYTEQRSSDIQWKVHRPRCQRLLLLRLAHCDRRLGSHDRRPIPCRLVHFGPNGARSHA